MTLTLSIIQKSYDLSIEVNGVTLTSTLVASSHTHTADEILDASNLGRNIMRAADAATVRTLIGAGTGGGAGLSDGDHGGVIVSGGGTVLELDYAEINATVQASWSRVTGLPNTMEGYGIGDGLTAAAAALTYQPLSAVLTATTASYTTAEKSKLAAIAAGATANATNAQLRDRSTHTGTQLAATISDFAAAADARVAVGITGKADVGHTHAFADLTAKPTTLAGYGIEEDANGMLPVVPATTGTWAHLGEGRGAFGARAETAGVMRMSPYVAKATGSITSVAVGVNTAVASSLAKVAIYESVDGRPSTLIAESSDIDCSVTGMRTATISAVPQVAGRQYWRGVRVNSTQSLNTDPNSPRIDGISSPASAGATVVTRNITYATGAPGTWGWTPSEATISRDPWLALGQYA